MESYQNILDGNSMICNNSSYERLNYSTNDSLFVCLAYAVEKREGNASLKHAHVRIGTLGANYSQIEMAGA